MNINQIIAKFDIDEQLTAEGISFLASAYINTAKEADNRRTEVQEMSRLLDEVRTKAEHFRSELFKLQNIRATHNRRKARAIARKLLAQDTAAALNAGEQ